VTDLSSGFQNEGKYIYAGSSRLRHVYTRVRRYKGAYAYTRTFMQGKVRICWRTYFWSLVFEPMVLDHGILSEVLIPSIGSMVLFYYGFGPWYCGRPKTIKEEGGHLAKDHLN